MIDERGASRERDAMHIVGPAALAILLMSYPWLAPAMQQRFVFGLPLVLIYFFVVWALLIAVAARLGADA